MQSEKESLATHEMGPSSSVSDKFEERTNLLYTTRCDIEPFKNCNPIIVLNVSDLTHLLVL